MKPPFYRPAARPSTIVDLFDIAFRLYRSRIILYTRYVALVFIFLSLFLLLILSDHLTHPFDWTVQLLLLGTVVVAPTHPVNVIFRETIFPDGVFIWTITAIALAPVTAYAYGVLPKPQHDFQALKRGSTWLLIVLVGLPVITLRFLGVGVFADLARIPFLLVPLVFVLEDVSVFSALRHGLRLAWHHLPRLTLMLILTLGMVRLALFLPFVMLFALEHRPLNSLMIQPDTVGGFVPFLAIGAELLVYPVAQIALILLYYDLRIRHEGLDIELVSSAKSGEPTV